MDREIPHKIDHMSLDGMDEIEVGLYSMEILHETSVYQTSELAENEADSMYFGSFDRFEPQFFGYDINDQMQACFEIILREFDLDQREGATLDSTASFHDLELQLRDQNLLVHWMEDESIDVMCQALEQDEIVLCMVNDLVLQNEDFAGLPGLLANRVLVATGIDFTNPVDPRICFKDPCTQTGKRICKLSTFLSSWCTGNNSIMTVGRERA